jgi:hypothetical protein
MKNDKIEKIDFVLYKTIRKNLNSKEKDFLITEDLENSKKYYEILNSIVQLIKTINKTKINEK